MNDAPQKKEGTRRGLLYALIPAGFVLLVLILFAMGFWEQEETEEPPTVVEPETGGTD